MRYEQRSAIESILYDPSRAAALFFLAGGLAGLLAVPGWRGTQNSTPTLLALSGCALGLSALLWILRERVTHVGHQVLMVIAVVIISVANAIEPAAHANVGVLYVWAAVYAAVYFPRNAIIFQNCCTSIGYLIALLVTHAQGQFLFSSWIFVTGTCVLLSIIIYGLVAIFRRISREDPLTRLANRRAWDERVEEEIARARRSRVPLSIIVADINHFKSINDRAGHQSGDRILRKFSKEWIDVVRGSGDFVARLGGDEFAFLVPGADEKSLRAIVNRIGAISVDEVTCSLGAATWNGTESASDLLHRADQAMYENKRLER